MWQSDPEESMRYYLYHQSPDSTYLALLWSDLLLTMRSKHEEYDKEWFDHLRLLLRMAGSDKAR